MKIRYIFLILILVGAGSAMAQSKKKKSKSKDKALEQESMVQPNSLTPYYPEQSRNAEKEQQKKSKGKKATYKVTYDAREKFYDRMEQVAKAYKKAEKEMQKPQYSDPSYFGHKRPPKKRPPGKMKYCKECGLKH